MRDHTLRIRKEPGPSGATARLEVEDQGIGIPAVDLPHICERFRRAKNVGGLTGTGIGLFTVREVVQAHHGEVSVNSQEGAGTTVVVRLPMTTT